ncbi:MAG: hypothetical protein Q3Y02_00855, partial [Dysosmobacter sp.]|nr:hypothetical protein [Dysosmobacter sp.]
MKAERLFQILGLVDESLIEEAVSASSPAAVQRRPSWVRLLAAAACLAVICVGAGGRWQSNPGAGTGSPGDAALAGGESGSDGHSPGTTFLSYAGPVFPLTTAETNTRLTAGRTVTWDFAPGSYEDGSPRQWGAQVTDSYTLTNPADGSVTVNALYPVSTSWLDFPELNAAVTVDSGGTGFSVLSGGYAGGFQDAGEPDGSTWNLAPPDEWADYQALLADGEYLSRAMEETAVPEVPVTVYQFTDFAAPHEEYNAATQAVTFTTDPEATTVLSYGFNGMSRDADRGWCQYSYFVPDGVRRETETKILIVLGDDIGDYVLQGYADGGCDQEIDGVSCTVTRRETTLADVLDLLCRAYQAEFEQFSLGRGQESPFRYLSQAQYQGLVWQLLEQYGLFSGTPKDRYSDGRLDEILMEALSQERVLYLSFPVTVPAGGSVTVAAAFWKAPSYDYGCSGSENVGLQGYDLVTALGSTLELTDQTAALVNTDTIEIVRQNLGFDLENGVTQVSLDLAEPHYYLEIRPLEGSSQRRACGSSTG